MSLHFLNDVLLQNFTLEAPQRIFQRFTVLNVNFGQHYLESQGNTKSSCCREEYCFAVVSGRRPGTVLAIEGEAFRDEFPGARGCLSQADIFGLQTLRSLLHNERDPCPFIQRTITASGYGGKMDEDVFAILALDKAKTFARVKPLYRACFFHTSSPSGVPAFLPYRLPIMPRSY